ncbi:mechanosensitive ion channel [Leptolyngbya cf. ectocarpi LEGE 11479]|uniref:Mechanosensitive ion channel n=1 Tax=Leptolyngbya cf. ectocarpi LEGE 11479 TaxID=1828722 RepID=A0A928X4A0_LEPEC|nr:mechanosensitive ion channel domain-containing protein [Leptolyngbya ectocarpi]MBE9066858.1 mechanosensitive ion channel [Leptolyngbya cf. ectocarpi LEGE 11479]
MTAALNTITIGNIIRFVIIPVVLVLGALFLGIVVERQGLNRLQAMSAKLGWGGADVIIRSLKGLILLWFVIGGAFAAILTLPLDNNLLITLQNALLVIAIASGTLIAARLAVGFVRYFSETKGAGNLTSLFEMLTQIVIFTFGVLIALQSLGIAITPLLTALGIGGVSLGLAFQSTLTNFLSGLNLATSNKLRVGDFIQLDSGEEGYVVDIAWRHTILQDIRDNMVVVPNTRILNNVFKNYGLPGKEALIVLEVGISYDTDLEQVERVALEIATEVMNQVEGGVPNSDPWIRYKEFGYFAITMTVYLRIQEYFDHLVVRHEFIKRLHTRFRQENIAMPFPIKAGLIPIPQSDTPKRNALSQDGLFELPFLQDD